MQPREYQRLHAAEERLWWFRALHAAVLNVLPASRIGRVLEIGCGTGGLMHKLRTAGYRPIGIDFAAEAIEFTRERGDGPVARASANELPFADSSFDLVTCVDVLEVGTVDPQSVVQSALRVLRPGGQALFVMAAHQWLFSEHDRAVNSVRRFNIGQLQALFEGKAVQIKRSSYFFLLVFPLVVLRKLLNKPRTGASTSDVDVPHGLINEPLYWLSWFEAQCLRILSLPIGSSVLVLVKKNG
ncbi:MAG: class I SAM-dependent methyltransferase [Anaerolineales bacterium]|nr:class I SAM-dependent methyltransferase [Anaerolineales bacterium]